jgi:hypothetical protein
MRKLALAAVLVVLAACSSNGYYPPYNNGPYDNGPMSSSSNPTDISGTVNYVDTNSGLISIDASYINNLRNTQNNYVVYYDSRTRVVYQNNSSYRPTDLERGDQVSIRGYYDGNRFTADTVTVTRNVRR